MSIDLATFKADLEYLTAGGEGIIYRVLSEPKAIYKEYKPRSLAALNVDALQRNIEFPPSLPVEDFARINSRTTWPKATVTRQGQVVGFVMRAIPNQYYALYGLKARPKRVVCDWNHLVYQSGEVQPHLMSDIPRLNTARRIRLIDDLAVTVELLHRHNEVVGDMSGRNLIWTGEPLRVAIIDCDGFRFEQQPGALPHKESPGWVDPALKGAPTTKLSDIYKLGVAAYKILWPNPPANVGPGWVSSQTGTRVPPDLRALIAASIDRVGRPTASEWTKTLDRLRLIDAGQRTDVTPLLQTRVNLVPDRWETTEAVGTSTRTSCPYCGGESHDPMFCPFFLHGGTEQSSQLLVSEADVRSAASKRQV